MSEKVLAAVTPSPARRWLAIGMMVVLGGLLVYIALAAPPQGLFFRVFMLAVGVGALLLAERLRRSTMVSIELTEAGLRDTDGRELCRFDNIAAVERGAFAFKPSNGFLVRLKSPMGRVWQPGLWWRYGRRIGVGGVTPASQAKFMADLIAMKLKGVDSILNELQDGRD
ncbi:MAG: hypothetical protein QNJ44_17360 [Rhodobacter sp.]|nr:hypothetical protein [Rhodobacter sp.]